MFKLKYYEGVADDLAQLPDDVYDEIYDMLHLLSKNPYKYTQKLDNMYGMNLRGYYKTYVHEHQYRIVSQIIDSTIQIVNIISIDERENFQVYKKAFSRIKNYNKSL